MLTVALLVIGFLLGDSFAAGVVGGFDLIIYWLWAKIIFVGIFGLLLTFGFGIIGAEAGSSFNKLGSKIGFGLGTLFGAALIAVIEIIMAVQLWLSYYIVENTPTGAESWATLPENVQYAIYGFAFLWLVSFIKSLFTKGSKND